MANYNPPPKFMAKVMNPIMSKIAGLLGSSRLPIEVLRVPGRSSGKTQEVPVTPIEFNGKRYLVAPRGETQWVRNARAAGSVSIGRKGRMVRYRIIEVADDQKAPILKDYIGKTELMTKSLFGLGKNASEAQVAAIAPRFPVFEIERLLIA